MKKSLVLFILLLSLISLSFVGCSSDSTDKGSKPADNNQAEQPEQPEQQDSKITSDANLPDMMDWLAYEIGTTGYTQAAGMANALTQSTGTQIRIVPNDTSVGRILVLKNGQADVGFLADEVYFASHGLYDFADRKFGPQDLRVVIAKPSYFAFAVTKESGIKTIEDLKGKRISYVPGNTSHIVKAEAYLAFGGLTWDDVEITHMASWADGARGLIEGKVDAVASQPTAATLYEVDSSPVGLDYIEMPASNVEGWKKVNEICPWLGPGVESRGAGMNGKEYEMPFYTYPQITCYSEADADMIYELVKALDESFELYKDMEPTATDWVIESSSGIPNGAPYHEGAIRYFKEKGLWTDAHEEWNNKQIEILKQEQEAWDLVTKEADEKNISDKDFPKYWLDRRFEIMGTRH